MLVRSWRMLLVNHHDHYGAGANRQALLAFIVRRSAREQGWAILKADRQQEQERQQFEWLRRPVQTVVELQKS